MVLEKAPKNIPNTPGVYFFKDEKDEVLYIGKAKDLKKRVASYFQNKKHNSKTLKMLSLAHKLEFTTVSSELEAIILEANLIKEHKPKYNIIMKDDKNFVYVRISTNEDFPKIELVRKLKKDKAKYFGPKTAAHKVKKTLKVLKKIFPYRHCALNINFIKEGNEKHKVEVSNKVLKYPCIDNFIKRCASPCIGKITPEEYKEIIAPIIKFFEGDSKEIIRYLEKKMQEAAAGKKFEKAVQIRDKLLMMKEMTEKQIISGTQHEFLDIIGLATEDKKAYITLFQIRDGKLINQENFVLENQTEDTQESIEAFIRDYYPVTTDFPKEILCSEELENAPLIKEWLKEITENNIKVSSAQKGKRKELIELANKNAKSFLSQQKTRWEEKEEAGIEELKTLLKLKKTPKRIEGYDISHLGGTNTVGSMVVFKNGIPSKQDYRHFRIKTLEKGKIDDFASLKEVFGRRLLRIKQQIQKQKNEKNFTARKLIKKYTPKFEKIRKKQNLPKELKESETCYILLKKENIIAYAILVKHSEELWQIKDTYIDKKYQSRTLEGMILGKCIKESKFKKIYTIVSTPETYEELGWKKSKTPPKKLEGKGTAMLYEKKKQSRESFTEIPDLILVDGGKGQLSQLTKVLKEYKLDIPAISLAKKEEEIFLGGETSPIVLEKTNPGLQLLQRIRDEAHRFAIEYNRSSRKREMLTTELDDIDGIGEKTRNELLKKFKTIKNIENTTDEELKIILSKQQIKALRAHFLDKQAT